MRTAAVVGALLLTACFSRPGLSSSDAGGDATVDAGTDGLPGGPYNVIFVTSDARSPYLLQNLANADAWCEQKAVNLPPNTYKAWISTSAEGAVARMGTAQGWVRPDGLPVADSLSSLTGGKHFYPPRLDEQGNDVTGSDPDIFTGTAFNGNVGANCGDLSNMGLNYLFGAADGAAYLWTEVAQHSCNQTARIYCMGTDHSNPITLARDPSRRIAFISSNKVGLGGGVDALDAECHAEAMTAGFGGTFRAAVAVTGQTIKERFPPGADWERRDGVVVIPADMSSVRAPLWLDAAAQPLTALPDSAVVWTGAPSFTTRSEAAFNCNDWMNTTNGPTAKTGFAVRSRLAYAIDESTATCNTQQRLYCLQM